MFRLAMRTLRFRTGAFSAAFIAMFLGAALVMACGGLMGTGIRTDVPPQQLTSSDIVIAGDQEYPVPGEEEDGETAIMTERVRVDADLVGTIKALPGVQDAEGHVFDGQPTEGGIDAINVSAEQGANVAQLRDQIDAELGGTDAVTLVGSDRGLAEFPQAKATTEDLISLAGVFGGWAIMVAMFGVASMLALSIQQRQREMALLRAVGTTPGQLRKMVLGETLVVAAIATALAVIPGRLLGQFLFERMTDSGVVSSAVALRQGVIPTAIAIGAAMIAAVGGAFVAGRRAAAIRPTQALAEVSLEGKLLTWPRIVFGMLFTTGGIALGIVTATVMHGPLASATAGPAVILWAIGLGLLSPALTKGLTALLQWPVRATAGVPGQLAVLNAKARTARTAAVVTPVILLTGIGTGTLYLQATEDAANRQDFADSLVADAVLTSSGEGIDPGLVERIGEIPGVAAVSEHVRSTGFVEGPRDPSQSDDGWTLQGVTADGAALTSPITETDGELTDLHGDTVALAADHADKLGVSIGDTITMRLGDNTTTDLDVVSLFSAADDYDTLLMPADVLAAHTTDGQVTELLVKAESGADTTQMVSALNQLAADEPGLAVADRDALFEAHADQQQTMTFANYTIVIMIAAYAAISVINTLATSTAARRKEFGLQRLIGSTRRQVMQMIGTEGALTTVIGVVLGTIAALGTLVPFSLARTDSLTPSGSPLIYVGVVGTALVLTVGSSLLAGRRALRSRPAEAAVAVD